MTRLEHARAQANSDEPTPERLNLKLLVDLADAVLEDIKDALAKLHEEVPTAPTGRDR